MPPLRTIRVYSRFSKTERRAFVRIAHEHGLTCSALLRKLAIDLINGRINYDTTQEN